MTGFMILVITSMIKSNDAAINTVMPGSITKTVTTSTADTTDSVAKLNRIVSNS